MDMRTLIKDNYNDLLQIACKLTGGNTDRAEDLLHDAISKMITHEDKYDHRNFFGYAKVVMFRINSNLNRSRFISDRGHAVFTERHYAYGEEIESDLHYKQMYDEIHKAIGSIFLDGSGFQDILEYKKNEYTAKEIVEETGMILNTVHGRYYRIKQSILNKYGDKK